MTNFRFGTLGGPCSVTCSPIGGGIYTLEAKAGVGDFFFPYCHVTEGGVGVCIVPVGQRNGVMAVTGGMNGCALQVNSHQNNLYFYHDANGTSMVGKLTPGEVVCRVTYEQYAGLDEKGRKRAQEHARNKEGSGLFGMDTTNLYNEFYLITVKHGGVWKVFCSSLMRETARRKSIWTGDYSTETSFQAFKPKGTTLVGLFADA